jgi:hypothetical protein
MSERIRRTMYVNNSAYLFVLLLALVSLALSDTALAAEDTSPHSTGPVQRSFL